MSEIHWVTEIVTTWTVQVQVNGTWYKADLAGRSAIYGFERHAVDAARRHRERLALDGFTEADRPIRVLRRRVEEAVAEF